MSCLWRGTNVSYWRKAAPSLGVTILLGLSFGLEEGLFFRGQAKVTIQL